MATPTLAQMYLQNMLAAQNGTGSVAQMRENNPYFTATALANPMGAGDGYEQQYQYTRKAAPTGSTFASTMQDIQQNITDPRQQLGLLENLYKQGYFRQFDDWNKQTSNKMGRSIAEGQASFDDEVFGGLDSTDIGMASVMLAPVAAWAMGAGAGGTTAAADSAASGATASTVGGTAGGQFGFGAGSYGLGASTPAMTTTGTLGATSIPVSTTSAYAGGLGAAGVGGAAAGELFSGGAELNPSYTNYSPVETVGGQSGLSSVPQAPTNYGPQGVDLTGAANSGMDWGGQGVGWDQGMQTGAVNTGAPATSNMPNWLNSRNVQTALQGAGALQSLASAEDMEDALHAQLQPGEPGYDYSQNWDLVEEYLRNPMEILKKNPGYLASVDFLEKQGRRQMASQGYTGSGNLNYYLADTLGKNANSWFNQAWQPIRDAAGLARPDQSAALGGVNVAAQGQIHTAKQNALGDLFNVGAKGIDSIFKNWTW